jgi:hypothetical protein
VADHRTALTVNDLSTVLGEEAGNILRIVAVAAMADIRVLELLDSTEILKPDKSGYELRYGRQSLRCSTSLSFFSRFIWMMIDVSVADLENAPNVLARE